MFDEYITRMTELKDDCFGKAPEPAYKRIAEAINFAALATWYIV